MDKKYKLVLLKRALGIKHKLKVLESVKSSDSHEDVAAVMLARWEYEDELRAIEEILNSMRQQTVSDIKNSIVEDSRVPLMVPNERIA